VPPADPRKYVRHEVRFTVELSSGGQLQTCQGEDIGAGGCRAVVLFPLQQGQQVRLRLRSERTALEVSGHATVAWTSRDPPYRVGLQFSDPLAEQAVRFIHEMLGPVRLITAGA
jgi:PilZ domain-containing protein